MHCTKISTEFEFGGHSPLDAHPKNVALGYDVGIISTGCLVMYCKHRPIFAQTSYQNDHCFEANCHVIHVCELLYKLRLLNFFFDLSTASDKSVIALSKHGDHSAIKHREIAQRDDRHAQNVLLLFCELM